MITDLQARPVELWLESLSLAPKSKVHIRGILSGLWSYAMWKQDISLQVNPISLVTIKNASKRVRKPRVLTVDQFRLLVLHLRDPFKMLALMCVCFGLRVSEALALKWADVLRGVNPLIAGGNGCLAQPFPSIPQIVGEFLRQSRFSGRPTVVLFSVLDPLLAVIALSTGHISELYWRLSKN